MSHLLIRRWHRGMALRLFLYGVLCCLPLAASTGDAPVDPASHDVDYARLYVDADGISHFTDARLALQLEDYAPPAQPMAIHALENAASATFVMLPPGAFEDWHTAPRRQFAVILEGTVEVTAADGEKRRFEPGMLVLLEDTWGRGHQTRVIGESRNLALMIAVPESE